MFLHHDDSFRDILMVVSARSGIAEDIVEKDYYVTMILKLLHEKNGDIVFIGGTSLSKAHHLIDRFSEDIDITFEEHIGESRRKKLKYNVLGKVGEELGLSIENWDKTESDKDYNRYEFSYHSVSDAEHALPPVVIVETALMSYSFPTEEKDIGNRRQ